MSHMSVKLSPTRLIQKLMVQFPFQVIIVAAHAVYDGTIRLEFDNTVCHGLEHFVVVSGQQNVPREGNQALVDGLDGLHVQVVGGLIHEDHIGAGEHHA